VTYFELLDENKCENNNFVSPVKSCQFYKEAGDSRGIKWPLQIIARESECPVFVLCEALNEPCVSVN
jgi:hypothetical protein